MDRAEFAKGAPDRAAGGKHSPQALIDLLQIDDRAGPFYRQLEERIIHLIRTEVLEAGSVLPAERQLAEALGVSRTTVQHCYNNLRRSGLLGGKGRSGSSILPLRLNTGMDRLKGFTEEMRDLGRVPTSEILQCEQVEDRSIASIFGLPSTAPLLKLVRIRKGDSTPMSREVAWYDLAAAPGLPGADLTGSVYDALKTIGVQLTHCEQSIEAASSSEEESAIFGFQSAQPCLLIKRRSFTADHRMIEYVEGLFRGDAYVYSLKLHV
jgi:GntR family transcriptional regulator